MSAPKKPGPSGPGHPPNPTQPPFPFQIALRVAAALMHVMFVSRVMLGHDGLSYDFTSLGALHGWLQDGWGSLIYFGEGLKTFAPWTVLECLTLIMVFGLPFQLLMRLSAAAALSVFVTMALANYVPGRPTLLLMVVTETLTLLLVLIARPAKRQDWHPLAALFTTGATYYFFFLDFGPGVKLVPEDAGVALQFTGIAWTIFAKLSLGRSFALLPADRGIVTHGAYGVIRHPVYLGYFIDCLGYLLPNFGWRNLLVYTVFFAFQMGRVLKEEKLLRGNPEYQAYCEKVRWRLIPFVF